jgi:monoamine oxidase
LLELVEISTFDEKLFKFHVLSVPGAAGYAAACKLLENGFKNVKIFEADNRIGGRIDTKFVNGVALDMGAQWIHGEDGNVVFKMASKLNLTKASIIDDNNYKFIKSNGNVVNGDLGQEQFEFFDTLTEMDKEFGKSSERMGVYISKK